MYYIIDSVNRNKYMYEYDMLSVILTLHDIMKILLLVCTGLLIPFSGQV